MQLVLETRCKTQSRMVVVLPYMLIPSGHEVLRDIFSVRTRHNESFKPTGTASLSVKHPDPQSGPTHWLPYAKLNLLRNPFGQLSREDRVAAAVVDLDIWLPQLKNPKFALQLLGDCGRGKSTHMHAILDCFPDGSYVYLPEDGPIPKIPRGYPLFIDEAQRLPWVTRFFAFRRGVPLVLATHTNLSSPLQRAGYAVETANVAAKVSTDRLQEIFRRRIELARLGEGEIPNVTTEEIESLVRRFGDNIRAMEEDLYQRFHTMTI